ncbi:RNA polymerase sigma-70 factor (ECF subfamily) [Panacagrimonas perspica]|uniref:RNA polymerase sigma-70 factor (ECF subfamily) n=1 Tax=Panacagrimonas perspica TaxID=381431 RepID=A0A4R7NYL0_9GAMM|nr:sigma-70 family RNA polymerase sigma factor [Panacagrimonas perspica]TDU25620.1 RNA polymerase sigma-70 factor (ECF subfamily) [Panacagrimonas perspica]THD03786.1 RNA polymerase subunit sigma [Panacagrimonas perspica]
MSVVEQELHYQIHTLYADHHGWLRTWLKGRLGCPEQAADIAHDTYLRVLKLEQLPSSEPRGYLSRIAKGLAIDAWRRRQIEAAYIELIASSDVEVPSEEQRALIVEALVELDRILDALPPKVKRAFLLRKLEGLRYAEIAAQLGVTSSSVEKYVATAVLCCAQAQIVPEA